MKDQILSIPHGQIIDDMMHVPPCDRPSFVVKEYTADLKVTGECIKETFLDMEMRQNETSIKFHLDHYFQETLTEYKKYVRKTLNTKRVTAFISPGVILSSLRMPEIPDQ